MTGSQGYSQKNKIVFATDVPCWREQTGAQQRILGLAKFLIDQGWDIDVVYLGSFADEQQTGFEKHQDRKINFISLIDDWQPQGLLEAAVWKLKCLGNSLSPKSSEQKPAIQSKRLSSFANPMFRQRFQDYLRIGKPEIVIVEYVTLSYLVPPRERRTGIQFWVDTHDLLSSRCRQFKELGLAHWVDITESEEASALNQFDGIIAIEASEADTFRSLTQNRIPIVVAGHAAQTRATSANEATNEIRVGIIASDNQINRIEIQSFLKEVWPKVIQSTVNPSVRLVVAGSICHTLNEFADLKGVERIGVVEKLEEFYDRIQIAINPIQFGTGLKIKSVEALSFGKPLVAARHSIAGLPIESTQLPFLATDSAEEMVAAISNLASNRGLLQQLSEAAVNYVERFLRPEEIYGALVEKFRESIL